MKRVLTTIIICVLFGAIVNVLVAWTFALAVPWPWEATETAVSLEERSAYGQHLRIAVTHIGTGTILIDQFRDYGHRNIEAFRSATIVIRDFQPLPPQPEEIIPGGIDLSPERPPNDDRGRPTSILRRVEGRGWPMISLWCERPSLPDRGPSGMFSADLSRLRGGVRIRFLEPWTDPASPAMRHSRMIPLRPRPLGFVINSLFYAAILAMLVPGVQWTMRRIRIRRGRCPKCGYPAGSSDVCTECGNELPLVIVDRS
jgi:hypothetical protein